MPAVLKFLLQEGFIDGSCLTVTGAITHHCCRFIIAVLTATCRRMVPWQSMTASGTLERATLCVDRSMTINWPCGSCRRKDHGGEPRAAAGAEGGAAGHHAHRPAHQVERPHTGPLGDPDLQLVLCRWATRMHLHATAQSGCSAPTPTCTLCCRARWPQELQLFTRLKPKPKPESD